MWPDGIAENVHGCQSDCLNVRQVPICRLASMKLSIAHGNRMTVTQTIAKRRSGIKQPNACESGCPDQ